MLVTKELKRAVIVLLAASAIGLGTTALTGRTLASDQGRAASTAGEHAPTDLPPISHVIDDETRLPPEAARWYAYVTTPFFPAELAYRQIPWLVDLNEAVHVARAEKRPLLLWTSGDDPLDRC
jgi:hypothetical protein